MINALVNVNGQLFWEGTAPEPKGIIPAFDRSFLYGDSLYEVARSYRGKFFLLDDHLARLQNSARLCRMNQTPTTPEIREQVLRSLEAFQKKHPGQDVYCRIILSRGYGKIGFGLANLLSPPWLVLILLPVEGFVPTGEKFERGLNLQISERLRNDRRALDPAMKSGNYLNSLLAYLEAEELGYDDAILCSAEGFVTEGTTFNIFYIKNQIAVTPPLEVGILDGITRRHVLKLAHAQTIPVREICFPRDRLYQADEVFLTSSVKEVFPITQIDGHVIQNGKAGPLTRRLAQLYRESVPR